MWMWALAGCLAFGSAKAAEPALLETVVKTDLTYATVGTEKLKLDLAMPKAGGPYPCLIGLHGGAWKSGSRKDLNRQLPLLDFGGGERSFIDFTSAHGYVVVTVSYRLVPKAKFPAQIEDVKAAIRWLRAHAAEYNIDPQRFGVLGFSAGGHLAALVGTSDKDAGFDVGEHLDQSSRVQAVADFFGPSDMSLYAETPGIEDAFMVPLLGARYADKPELFRKASPIEYVTKDDPPFLIMHGTLDVIVPLLHSKRLHEKLLAVGVKSEFIPMRNRGHGWFDESVKESNKKMLAFFADAFKAKP